MLRKIRVAEIADGGQIIFSMKASLVYRTDSNAAMVIETNGVSSIAAPLISN